MKYSFVSELKEADASASLQPANQACFHRLVGSNRAPGDDGPAPLPEGGSRSARWLILLGLVLALAGTVKAQTLPLEIRQDSTRYNLSSTNGLPLSSTRGTPPGSDGRGPTSAQQQAAGLTLAPATIHQFQGLLPWAASVHPTSTNLNSNLSLSANAENLGLPRAKVNNQIALILPQARLGQPFLSRKVSFLFGQVIPPPNTDEFGVPLSISNTNVLPNRPAVANTDYWLAEPYSTLNHTNANYYWSPHAQSVFAINPGPLQIAWRRSATTTNAAPPSGVTTVQVLGLPYVVFTNQYVISGSPVKTPRRMYWTERSFIDTGKPVTVPSARVSTATIIYNASFPERVANEVVIPGSSPITTSNTLAEVRTFWLDDSGGPAGSQFRAYNVEGRIFVELLGDARNGSARQHLGFEIVDVSRQPVANDITIELGERLTAYPDNNPSDDALIPEPPLFAGSPGFTFQYSPPGSSKPSFYATRETINQNDLQMHWLEEGLEGLRWPHRFSRYKLVWPSDVAKYTHYIRPSATSEGEARATAVALPTENAPIISYQDPLDQPRGKLTETFAYYSWLTPQYPAHRALLQFSSGANIRFERIFSWLDEGLRRPDLTLPNFRTDFETGPGTGTVAGISYIDGGILHLTDAVGGQTGGYQLEDFTAGQTVQSFRARFRVKFQGNGALADGLSFNFGAANPVLVGEEGTSEGISVTYDLWDNGVGDYAPGIAIKVNGTVQAAVSMLETDSTIETNPPLLPAPKDPTTGRSMTFQTGDAFVPTEIVLTPDGLMDVYFKDVKVLSRIATGYTPQTGRFFLAARTGGSFAAQWIKDLDILVNQGTVPGLNTFAQSVATNLNSWVANSTFQWPDTQIRPRVETAQAYVGDRLQPPAGELGGGSDTNYLAGYIVPSQGNAYHAQAYVNPFVAGFEQASRGAIIPVNAIPGANQLEVWWFRRNTVDAGQGFKASFWPSVITKYTIAWPDSASEIVLASNAGSGPLPSLQSTGGIYYQNDRTLPGFNPNEEHALMQGGQVFALRDDLNITNPGGNDYSSQPFVLLSYTEADQRPAVRPFRVLREKPELGWAFDFTLQAGSILQAPMPLPLMEKPLSPAVAGAPAHNLNTEIQAWTVASSTTSVDGGFARTTLNTAQRNYFTSHQPIALQAVTPAIGTPLWVFPTNVGPASVQGWLSASRPATLSAWSGAPSTTTNRLRFTIKDATSVTNNSFALLYSSADGANWAVKVTAVDAPAHLLEVQFADTVPAEASSATDLVIPQSSNALEFTGYRLAYEPYSLAISNTLTLNALASFTLQDRKGNLWIYRGPHSDGEKPSMVMQFYYRTQPGFFFPSLAAASQPPVGTITPYLRATDETGAFIGDPVYGNRSNPQEGDGQPLGVTYHPVWPDNVPVLQMAETLLTPKRGLPAIRGASSLELVYQQSQVLAGEAAESVVLHDPTREKISPLKDAKLDRIPSSISTQDYQGNTYFPKLPPHLVERFFFDPNQGTAGALVFKGVFNDAALGDTSISLNVLGLGDLGDLKGLCAVDDADKARWDAAIDGLSTVMEYFIENPARPGTYMPSEPEKVSATGLARVRNDDVAVDSYALTATGPGVGYVSLIAGNGRAFTPEAAPIRIHIIKVVPTLYRGEVNIVESSNPLNEKLTLQQVVDLAGRNDLYNFEWRIAAPVDGLPPVVYQNTPRTLMAEGAWMHVRFPLPSDAPASVAALPSQRILQDTVNPIPVSRIQFDAVTKAAGLLYFATEKEPSGLTTGNKLTLRRTDGTTVNGMVHALTTQNNLVVSIDPGQDIAPGEITEVQERVVSGQAQSLVFRTFTEPKGNFSQYWLSLQIDDALGAQVYMDGQLAVRRLSDDASNTPTTTAPAGLSPLDRVYQLNPSALTGGILNPDGSRTHTVAVELYSTAFAGQPVTFNVRLEAFESLDVTSSQWLSLDSDRYRDGVRAILGGDADVQSLADNYLIMRYQARETNHASYVTDGLGGNASWSQWTTPQLAEGWIKRVLKGINPFNQRITDLFNNSVNTDVSLVAQAGGRWEGDVALNLETINNTGLIEIYETVLNRGKSLSIGSGINYGPANDALLLAAGYLNDLYMVLGNEAWADAANPTIGIGTKDNTYGEIATALFAFRGQLPSLLEEELALLRGRDDFLLPGVELRPVYNRLVWNYTRGIDAGEVVYALNYNILDQNGDGKVDANDARTLYPQGHGDAYGHYLTALKGYYALLLDSNFDWVPRSEAVTVLGKPVSVDYQDERKFAAAAGAVARTGKQIFDLTWRRDYKSGPGNGWSHFSATKANSSSRQVPTTQSWGLDHWASRTGQGSFLNWVVGNTILPDHDPDPKHKGSIQQIDRTTVPELKELTALASSLQTAMDNAEAGLTPLGIPDAALPFDLNPLSIGNLPNSHFEQVLERAKGALKNAVASFDDAKDVTRLMRSEEDSLAEFRTELNQQERAFTNALIEIYGTPYPEDIGPGKTYRSGYAGPDVIHYMYVETPEVSTSLLNPSQPMKIRIDTQTFVDNWVANGISDFNFITKARTNGVDGVLAPTYETNNALSIEFTLDPHGFFQKPTEWHGRRTSPGRIQQAISDIIKARNAAYMALYNIDAAKGDLDWAIRQFELKKNANAKIREFQSSLNTAEQVLETSKLAFDISSAFVDRFSEELNKTSEAVKEAIPKSFIAGLSVGGDLTAPIRATIDWAAKVADEIVLWGGLTSYSVQRALEYSTDTAKRFVEFNDIAPLEFNQELRDATTELRDKVYGVQNLLPELNARLQELDDTKRALQSVLAEGVRLQSERQIYRQRAAAIVQGFRSRDAAFRIFRNEKLERYKTLFDLASRYAFMAAQAYDYDTGLLSTSEGREFINRIIRARALGIVLDGNPQFAGSNTGDPGLSSTLAEMMADWQVLRSRLGFNNPDAYGTTVSLRTENFRILPGTNGDPSWRDVLNQSRRANLLDDPDVRRYCMQIDRKDGQPVPGIVVEFGTTIADGLNLFGRPLAAWDHAFSPTAFSTKIFAAGVSLEGYKGMDDPAANGSLVTGSAGESPGDPDLAFLDPNSMSANPYIYLIPVGVDSMRSPALGDTSVIRTWNVQDVTIPLPFNLGGSDFSSTKYWQSSDSLTEPMFSIRKHQAFRPVSSSAIFGTAVVYWTGGELERVSWTNARLLGRSVWNSKWKIVIPGRTLLNNPDEGLERFIKSVKDIRIYWHTYSYSGN